MGGNREEREKVERDISSKGGRGEREGTKGRREMREGGRETKRREGGRRKGRKRQNISVSFLIQLFSSQWLMAQYRFSHHC